MSNIYSLGMQAPSVICRGKTAQSISNNSTFVQLTNWTETQDTTNSFNAVAGIFTAPIAGNYQYSIAHNLLVTGAQIAASFDHLSLKKNGVDQFADSRLNFFSVAMLTSQDSLAQMSGIINLAIGDTMAFTRRQSHAAAYNDTTSASQNYINISYIK